MERIPAPLHLQLRYADSDGTWTERELPMGVTIGRHPDCQIQILDRSIQRAHCEIELIEGRWRVRDLGSEHGTWLNGERVTVAPLAAEDQIRVGREQLFMVSAAPWRVPAWHEMFIDQIRGQRIQAEMLAAPPDDPRFAEDWGVRCGLTASSSTDAAVSRIVQFGYQFREHPGAEAAAARHYLETRFDKLSEQLPQIALPAFCTSGSWLGRLTAFRCQQITTSPIEVTHTIQLVQMGSVVLKLYTADSHEPATADRRTPRYWDELLALAILRAQAFTAK